MDFTQDLAACYEQLGLPPGASLAEVDAAYFKLRSHQLKLGDRQGIAPLKAAWQAIHSQHLPQPAAPTLHQTAAVRGQPTELALDQLRQTLSQNGLLHTRASIQGSVLNLGIPVSGQTPAALSAQVTTALYRWLDALNDPAVQTLETVHLYGLSQTGKALWKRRFPLTHLSAADVDLCSFQNRFSNTFIFPSLLALAAALNGLEPVRLLLFGIDVWIHEVGHAAVAWLCGRRALPLPFGWTSVNPERSTFVYFAVLLLLALLAWAGIQENRRWPLALAGGLAVLQFWGTWVVSPDTFDMLLSFGGIGGEFYLSTLLIVSFYFPLPDYFRWDFYRYPTLIAAGFTFLGSFWQWRQIDRGLEAIPWGSIFGGAGDAGGDMNQLNLVHSWSTARIIDTYNGLGSFCAIAIISVYLYIFFKQRNHRFVQGLWRRWQAQSASFSK